MDHDPVALCGHDDCHVNNLGFGIWGGVLDGEALDSGFLSLGRGAALLRRLHASTLKLPFRAE